MNKYNVMLKVKINEYDSEDEYLISIRNISYIHAASNTIIVSGNHGLGNSVIHLQQESMDKLLKYIEVVE